MMTASPESSAHPKYSLCESQRNVCNFYVIGIPFLGQLVENTSSLGRFHASREVGGAVP
jgi:hypothetical protein